MADGRRGSVGSAAAAASLHSHHSHTSSERSVAHLPLHSARGGGGVALLDTGADPYDRFKLMFTGETAQRVTCNNRLFLPRVVMLGCCSALS